MQPIHYTMWEEPNGWHGYLKDHPDQVVQGKSFDDLQLKLRHLKRDLSGQSRRQELPPPYKPHHEQPNTLNFQRYCPTWNRRNTFYGKNKAYVAAI